MKYVSDEDNCVDKYIEANVKNIDIIYHLSYQFSGVFCTQIRTY